MADRGAVFQIEIFSDIICPWCYIGTRLLWKAIAELSQNHRATEFRFKWRPYMIAPGVGEKGEAMRDFMHKRYGRALDRDKDLSEAALEAGVSLEGGLLSRQMWNSAAAHSLVQLAGEQQGQQGQPDLQTAMMEALFEAYFHREQNIAALACLQDLADKVGVSCEGLSTGSVAALAATYKEPVEARGVKGVPYFCISRQGYPGSFRFSGAQFPRTFVRAFQSLLVDRDQLVSAIRSRATPPRTTSTNSTPVSHECQEPAPVRRGSAFALGEEAETGVDNSTSRTRSRSPLSHTGSSSTTDCESESTGRRFKRQRPAEPSPRIAIKSPVDEAVERGDDVQAAAEALSNVRAHGRVRSHEASPRLPQLNPVAASGKQAVLPWVLAATEGSSGGGGSGRALPPPLPHPFAHRILQAPPHAGGGEVVYYYGQMHTGHDAHVLAHALRELPRERPSSYSCAQPLPPALRQPPTLRSPLALFEERRRAPLPPPPQQQQHRRRSPDAAAPHAALECGGDGGGGGAEAGRYGGGAPAMGHAVYHTGGYDVALAHGHPAQQRYPRQASPCSVDGSNSSSGGGSSAQHHVRYSISSAHAAESYAACRQLPQSPSVIGASPHSHGLPLHRAQPTSSM